ncbi:hypothetical protein [Nocardia brasiliensis]|uniref:Ig-like domain-containing protein n=1 Tax=Nocardia brasiliensis (strain ATCC 700358 / HUJEG-1) TaxID=1133849 RepID=K0ESZ0_NOCB7|nr:hypothetical protein [Nocardia brasiliensis]AFU00214.1 hypothetical protein O3I_011265 [Nocardia brasiliensis ATCC 700358]OCF86391.1 hypothetical protein AW168_32040 [Nocardia brasiliensis]
MGFRPHRLTRIVIAFIATTFTATGIAAADTIGFNTADRSVICLMGDAEVKCAVAPTAANITLPGPKPCGDSSIPVFTIGLSGRASAQYSCASFGYPGNERVVRPGERVTHAGFLCVAYADRDGTAGYQCANHDHNFWVSRNDYHMSGY